MDGRVLPVLLGPTGHPPKWYEIPVPTPDGGPPTVLLYERVPAGAIPAGRRTHCRPTFRPLVTFGARGDAPARTRPRPEPAPAAARRPGNAPHPGRASGCAPHPGRPPARNRPSLRPGADQAPEPRTASG